MQSFWRLVYIKSIQCFLPSNVDWPVRSGEDAKNRFSSWPPPRRPSLTSDWPLSSGEEAKKKKKKKKKKKNRFSRWLPWRSLRFLIRMILAIFALQLTWCFLLSFKSIGHLVQEKMWKIDFQDGGQLWFPIRTMLTLFDQQVTAMLPPKFQVNWPFGSGEEGKIDFQDCGHGGHLGFPIGMSLVFFSTNHRDGSCQILSQLSVQEKKRKIDFQEGGHLWIPIGSIFGYFWSISHPDTFYQVSSQLTFRFTRRSEKKDFQDGSHGAHFGFPIRTIFTIFDLYVTLMLPTVFKSNGLLVQEKKGKYIFKMAATKAIGFPIGMILVF